MTENGEQQTEAMSFENAMSELETIVSDLEKGETDLEGAIAAYERGVTLKKYCEEKLRQAQLRVDKIESDASGAVRTETFETD